jgi:hypothetical protein
MDKMIDRIVHFCLDTKLVILLIVIAFILKVLSIY